MQVSWCSGVRVLRDAVNPRPTKGVVFKNPVGLKSQVSSFKVQRAVRTWVTWGTCGLVFGAA